MSKFKTFIVEGTGVFPIDMLRFDACYPRTSADIVKISSIGMRRVELRTHATHSPTPDRWNLFLWSVVN